MLSSVKKADFLFNISRHFLPKSDGQQSIVCKTIIISVFEFWFLACKFLKNTAYIFSKICPIIIIYSLNTYKCHKSNIKILLMKSSEIVFIFLPAFYLIIWLMTSPKNFEKIFILKICQLVFFWGVKIYFGKFLLKWCIFRDGKIWLSQIMPFDN